MVISNMRRLAAAACVATFTTAVPALAATVGFTEGNRATVAETTQILDVRAAPGRAFNLGTIGSGDTVNVFGLIGNGADSYAFNVTARSFRVALIGRGFTPVGYRDTSATLRLRDGAAPYVILDSLALVTSVLPGSPVLFRGDAGLYVLQFDGRATSGSALYDVEISAVPLPAAGLLLLAGLGALGVAARRKKTA